MAHKHEWKSGRFAIHEMTGYGKELYFPQWCPGCGQLRIVPEKADKKA